MTSYQPQEGIYMGRPPCAACGAAYRLHHQHSPECLARTASGRGGCWCASKLGYPRCPEAYRPDTLLAAQAQYDRAIATGDQAAIFVARGELQRLGATPPEDR